MDQKNQAFTHKKKEPNSQFFFTKQQHKIVKSPPFSLTCSISPPYLAPEIHGLKDKDHIKIQLFRKLINGIKIDRKLT